MTAFRYCNHCDRDRLVDGGVQLNPGRWLCASCWMKYLSRKTRT